MENRNGNGNGNGNGKQKIENRNGNRNRNGNIKYFFTQIIIKHIHICIFIEHKNLYFRHDINQNIN